MSPLVWALPLTPKEDTYIDKMNPCPYVQVYMVYGHMEKTNQLLDHQCKWNTISLQTSEVTYFCLNANYSLNVFLKQHNSFKLNTNV